MTDLVSTSKMSLVREGCYIYFKKRNSSDNVRYDLREQELQKLIDGVWRDVQHQYHFFMHVRIDDIDFGTDIKFKKFFEVVKKFNEGCVSLSTFITRMYDHLHLEGYITENIEFEIERYYWGERLVTVKHPITIYTKPVLNFIKKHNIKLRRSFEEFYMDNKDYLNTMLLKMQTEDFTIEEQMEVWTILQNDHFKTLVEEYKCDPMSLLKYVMRYLKPFENIEHHDALSSLDDYYRMAARIGRKVKKYPKYLNSMHDILTANYNSYKQTYDERAFLKRKRDDLIYADTDYCIVLPESTKDVVREGTELNHCVASYVDKIIKGETYIMFLRCIKTKEASLVTVEVKNNEIVQAKGSYNRKMNDEEKAFMTKFCKLKKLKFMNNEVEQ
jgi:hypothetical protein